MMYGQNAIAVNEFLGKSWRHVRINFMRETGNKFYHFQLKLYANVHV